MQGFGRAVDFEPSPGWAQRAHGSHLHVGNMPERNPEWEAQWQARKQAARLRKGEQLAALAGVTDPVLRAVIDHHARDDSYGLLRCAGCDQGCSCDSATWPCSTVVTVLDALGVDTTDIGYADWHRET